MKLSVIIPVFRVESTLSRCVESVLRQNILAMEVILVDDGSPDQCPKICDEWAGKDNRIRVIHKENGGLSDARNAGIEIATGDYITFVDSDDWIAPDSYAPLLQQIGDNDILEYAIAGRLTFNDHTYHDVNEYWLYEQAYKHAYAWNKIYRRSLFDQIRYPKGKVFEDVYTLPLLLKKAKKVATSSYGCYHYCFNPNGITATADGQALTQLLNAHLDSQMPVDDCYYMYLVNIQIDVWERTHADIRLPRRKVNISSLKSKQKIKGFLLNIIGINKLCKISQMLHQLKSPIRL